MAGCTEVRWLDDSSPRPAGKEDEMSPKALVVGFSSLSGAVVGGLFISRATAADIAGGRARGAPEFAHGRPGRQRPPPRSPGARRARRSLPASARDKRPRVPHEAHATGIDRGD